eukprot:scaffold87939_cov79-Phaeocystis_antarctica.AAC.2
MSLILLVSQRRVGDAAEAGEDYQRRVAEPPVMLSSRRKISTRKFSKLARHAMIIGASPPPGWPSERNALSLCGQVSLNMSKTSRAHPSLPQAPQCAPQQRGHLLSEQTAGTAC